MAEQPKNKKKKTMSIGWLIFALFIVLANISESVEDGAFARLLANLRFYLMVAEYRLGVPLPVLLGGCLSVIAILLLAVSAAKKKAKESDADTPTMKKARASAAVQRQDPRTKSFTEPDAYCFSCEATGEDHFQHDKAQRIRQLNDWLKNGLIDREEYQVLKSRFERDL